MSHAFSHPMLSKAAIPNMLIEVARCWSKALKSGTSAQPCLYRVLSPHNIQILAPVLDSLLRFYERALGRSLAVGSAANLTSDEAQLLGFMDGSIKRNAFIICSTEAASGLDRAISSARIMMHLASSD